MNVWLALLLSTAPVNADALVEEATALHADNRYAEAGEKLLAAYELSHDPSHLNHAARCFDLAGETASALTQWRRYRALNGPTAEEHRYADARIELLAARLVTKGPPAPPPLTTPDPIVVAEERPPEPPPWPAITLTAAGSLTAIVGGVFVASAALREERVPLRNERPRGLVNTSEPPDYSETYAIGGTLLGVGIATATAGIIWWILD
ncbi:MAG: hypothetical protein RIT81_08520 [Deltaproteobacteria bacterium]